MSTMRYMIEWSSQKETKPGFGTKKWRSKDGGGGKVRDAEQLHRRVKRDKNWRFQVKHKKKNKPQNRGKKGLC